MALAKRAIRLKKAVRSVHFWLILAILAVLSVLHYAEYLGIASTSAPSAHFGLTRHALDRILFLIPIIYAGYIFGLRAGLATCFVVLLLVLPRALYISPGPPDALLESAGVLLGGALACFWFKAQLRAKEQSQQVTQVTTELETVQQDLQSHIRLSRSNEKRLATLNAISGMLSRSLELGQVLRDALDMVMEVMEVEAALIFSLDKEAQELRLVAYEGVSDRFALDVDRIKLGEGFNGLVAQTGQPLLVEDASHDPRLTRQMVRREKIQAQLIVPLRARGLVTGTLCVMNRRPRQFLAEEVELLTAIGSQIGIAVENADLYQKQLAIAAQYRDIFENASDAIWVHDLEGNILTANDACRKLTGYAPEELNSMNSARLFPERDLESIRDIESKLLEGKAPDRPCEVKLVKKDGTEAIVELTTNLLMTAGQAPSFQHIARDVTEQRRMQENLHFYIQQITRAQEEERKRIARELHDETAQQLIALSHQLEDFTRNNERLSPDDIQLIKGWRDRLRDTLQGVRLFSRDLRPPMLDDLGLLPALEWLASDMAEQSGIAMEVKALGGERRLPAEVELVLFRIAQEALRNVLRHSQATRAEVIVEFDEGKARITVSDNGKGFDPSQTLGDLSKAGKLGLAGMQERAQLLGGALTVQSESGSGTTVTVVVPV
ncbi:MAG TPA: PAS domain S-box protein [Dehalococcoidia bacterium]|nr:PAS domain S-box protein [Dehalococcoidia bacterium]